MTQQATPSLQVNLAGSSTNVNLRDWLNTRLAPFLKKAIIDSLDTEAEFPLQWLGEHLIEQSILFEGNPDSTGLREKFRYDHESAAITKQTPSQPPLMSAPEPAAAASPAPESTKEPQPAKFPPTADAPMNTGPEGASSTTPSLHQQENAALESTPQPEPVAVLPRVDAVDTKDTEMSNTN